MDLIGFARDARTRREQADYDVLGVAMDWAVAHEVHGPVTRDRSGAAGQPGEGTGEFPDTGPVGPEGSERPFEDLAAVPDALLSALERAARRLEKDAGSDAGSAGDPTPDPNPDPKPEPAAAAGPVGTRVDRPWPRNPPDTPTATTSPPTTPPTPPLADPRVRAATSHPCADTTTG